MWVLKLHGHNFFDASCLVEFWFHTALLSNDTVLFDKFLESATISLFTQLFQWKKSLRMEPIIYLETSQSFYIAYIKPRINSNVTLSIKDSIKALQVEAQHLVNPKNKSVQPILGVCWGPNNRDNIEDTLVVSGQSFWSLVDDGGRLFNKILTVFSLTTLEQSAIYDSKKTAVLNNLTREFLERFCDDEGAIDWVRLIEFNSGNYDLHRFMQ